MSSGPALFRGLQLTALLTATGGAVEDWPVSSTGLDGAYTDCACVFYASNHSLEQRFPELVTATSEGLLIMRRQVEGQAETAVTLPLDYGKRCSDYDATVTIDSRCEGMTRPLWCDLKWCYVDATSCRRKFGYSEFFPGLGTSYATCGNLDLYLSPAYQAWNTSISLYAFAFGYQAEEEPLSDAAYLNMFLSFASLVIPQAGIPLENIRYRSQLSNATKRKFASTYTGCVHDIGLGNFDLCLGDFWDTQERQEFGAASFVSVAGERMLLLAPIEQKEEDLWAIMGKPFAPFSKDLWALILAVILVVGVIMIFLEYGRVDGDFAKLHFLKDFVKSIYLSATCIVNASICFTSVTTSGRLVSIGYGVFVLVGIASYTAEMASFLIENSMEVRGAQSIESALDKSARICYSMGMQHMLEAKYKKMKILGVPIDSTSFVDFVEKMESGACKYSICGEVWPIRSWEKGEHCQYHFVGSSVLVFPTGYWVSNELRARLGWSVAYLRNLGAWGSIELEYGGSSICEQHSGRRLKASGTSAKSASAAESQSGPKPLTSSHMLGTLLVLTLFTGLAILVRLLEVMCCGVSEEDKTLLHSLEDYVESSLHVKMHDKNIDSSLQVMKCFSELTSQAKIATQKLQALKDTIDATYTQHVDDNNVSNVLLGLVSNIIEGTQEVVSRSTEFEQVANQIVKICANLKPGDEAHHFTSTRKLPLQEIISVAKMEETADGPLREIFRRAGTDAAAAAMSSQEADSSRDVQRAEDVNVSSVVPADDSLVLKTDVECVRQDEKHASGRSCDLSYDDLTPQAGKIGTVPL